MQSQIDRVIFQLADGSTIILVPERPPQPRYGTGHLSPMARSLLAAMVPEPRSAEVLARRAGYVYNSRLRQTLAQLVRDRLALHGPEGYARMPEAV